jgi:hypothetical protein
MNVSAVATKNVNPRYRRGWFANIVVLSVVVDDD